MRSDTLATTVTGQPRSFSKTGNSAVPEGSLHFGEGTCWDGSGWRGTYMTAAISGNSGQVHGLFQCSRRLRMSEKKSAIFGYLAVIRRSELIARRVIGQLNTGRRGAWIFATRSEEQCREHKETCATRRHRRLVWFEGVKAFRRPYQGPPPTG